MGLKESGFKIQVTTLQLTHLHTYNTHIPIQHESNSGVKTVDVRASFLRQIHVMSSESYCRRSLRGGRIIRLLSHFTFSF